MKYVIWAVRFWYAAWMIPAGLEHFYHIYPQPGANSSHPLAAEMLTALLNTHLFDLVKAVELITGVAVLFGFFTPLSLLICMPGRVLRVLVGFAPVGMEQGKRHRGGQGAGQQSPAVRRLHRRLPVDVRPARERRRCQPGPEVAGTSRACDLRRVDAGEWSQPFLLLVLADTRR